jgi:hypothetical protein
MSASLLACPRGSEPGRTRASCRSAVWWMLSGCLFGGVALAAPAAEVVATAPTVVTVDADAVDAPGMVRAEVALPWPANPLRPYAAWLALENVRSVLEADAAVVEHWRERLAAARPPGGGLAVPVPAPHEGSWRLRAHWLQGWSVAARDALARWEEPLDGWRYALGLSRGSEPMLAQETWSHRERPPEFLRAAGLPDVRWVVQVQRGAGEEWM